MNVNEDKMKINYNRLWKFLVDKNMNKKDLFIGKAWYTIFNYSKNTKMRICIELYTDVSTIILLDRASNKNNC